MHHVAEQSLLDLGLLVQMTRPDRLKQARYVRRVCEVAQEEGVMEIKELFARERDSELRRVADPGRPSPPDGGDPDKFRMRVRRAQESLDGGAA